MPVAAFFVAKYFIKPYNMFAGSLLKVKMKRISEYGDSLKYSLLIFLAVLFAAGILYLGWLNHLDFEHSVVKAELRELQILAKSAAQGIQNSIYSIHEEPEGIAKLVEHINQEEALFSFILDEKHTILSHPNKNFIGKNIIDVSSALLDKNGFARLSAFLEQLDTKDSGTAIMAFAPEKAGGKTDTLLAFSQLINKGKRYDVVVAESLAVFTVEMHRHLIYTILLVALSLIILSLSAFIFYRIQKKRLQMEVSARALEIINKQLHCQIDDYRQFEGSLKHFKNTRK